MSKGHQPHKRAITDEEMVIPSLNLKVLYTENLSHAVDMLFSRQMHQCS